MFFSIPQHRPAAECNGEGNPANVGDESGCDEDSVEGGDGDGDLLSEAGDSMDEAGVEKMQRQQRKKKGGRAVGVASDAQLSCPLCFTTVCLECQRHAKYHNQVSRGACVGVGKGVPYWRSAGICLTCCWLLDN